MGGKELQTGDARSNRPCRAGANTAAKTAGKEVGVLEEAAKEGSCGGCGKVTWFLVSPIPKYSKMTSGKHRTHGT